MIANGEVLGETNELGNSLKRIREIKKDRFEVALIIHRYGLDRKTAVEVDSALIDAYPEALNQGAGYCSDERGIMHSTQAIKLYKTKEIDFQHKVLMISINRSIEEANYVYEAVRYAWKLNPKKLKDLILS